jgi:hypothetical protein
MKITIREKPGRCRWCGCTDVYGCDVGCSWVNAQHNLCDACQTLDEMMRTVSGRAALAQFCQEHNLEGGR